LATIDEIRMWAMSLPDVTEKQHHRFHVPLWQVRGKTFTGMGRDQTTVVCCITESSAGKALAADVDGVAAVRRMNAQRSFLGVEVELASVPAERIEGWIREAWAAHAPRALLAQQGDP
jgi:hypothetical protein